MYPLSDHCDGKNFFNPAGPGKKNLTDVVKWMATSKRTPWPEHVDNKPRTEGPLPLSLPDGQTLVTFVNHATVYLQLGPIALLTDPVFSNRVSPLTFAGPRRVRDPGLAMRELPRVDAVLISHNHYDHLDAASLRELKKRFDPWFLTGLGNETLLASLGITKIKTLDWWSQHTAFEGIQIHYTPAQHWSGRGLGDRNTTLWGGFSVCYFNEHLYFAGDTGFCQAHFEAIKNRLGPPTLAMLPIGAYEPRWFMRDQHMNPAEAVQAHILLGANKSMGIHFGTFQLTDEGIDAPQAALAEALSHAGVPSDSFITLENGHSFFAPRIPSC